MKTLLLETATEKPVIALAEGGMLLAKKLLPSGPELSKRLALEVHELLANFQPERIAVGQGPGSYTGIRVGACLGQALAFAWELPLIGFCSLKAFLPPVDGPFATLLDARMGGVYALKGRKDGKLCTFEEPRRIPLLEAPAFLEGISHLCSPQVAQLKEKISFHGLWFESSPNVGFLAELVEQEPDRPLVLTYLSSPVALNG